MTSNDCCFESRAVNTAKPLWALVSAGFRLAERLDPSNAITTTHCFVWPSAPTHTQYLEVRFPLQDAQCFT